MLKRLITVQGPVQFINVVSTLLCEKRVKKIQAQDTLLIYGMYSTTLDEIMTDIANVWSWQSIVRFPEMSMFSLNDIRNHLENISFDEIYMLRNWAHYYDMAIPAAYSASKLIIYGDGFGHVHDANNQNTNYEIKTIMPVETSPNAITGKTYTITKKAYALEVMGAIAGISKIYQEIELLKDECVNKEPFLLMLMNGVEGGYFKNIEEEIDFYYMWFMMYGIPKDDAVHIFIKSHVRETKHQAIRLVKKIRAAGYQASHFSDYARHLPIELFFLFIPEFKHIPFLSTSILSVKFFFNIDPEPPLLCKDFGKMDPSKIEGVSQFNNNVRRLYYFMRISRDLRLVYRLYDNSVEIVNLPGKPEGGATLPQADENKALIFTSENWNADATQQFQSVTGSAPNNFNTVAKKLGADMALPGFKQSTQASSNTNSSIPASNYHTEKSLTASIPMAADTRSVQLPGNKTMRYKNFNPVNTENIQYHSHEVSSQALLKISFGDHQHPSWKNIDFASLFKNPLTHEFSQHLSFGRQVFDAVYHSHLLEHIREDHVPVFFKACFHALRPGGIIRVVVPNLENITKIYLEVMERAFQGDAEAQSCYDWILSEIFEQMVRSYSADETKQDWKQNPRQSEAFMVKGMEAGSKKNIDSVRAKVIPGNAFEKSSPAVAYSIGELCVPGQIHRWVYDRYALGRLLQETGFKTVTVCQANDSSIPDFNSYFLDIKEDGRVRMPGSLYMEGIKSDTAFKTTCDRSQISQNMASVQSGLYPPDDDCSQKVVFKPDFCKPDIKIAIDAVFFQLNRSGIARLWKSLLEEWSKSDFARYLVVLDRDYTAPRISGIHYIDLPAYKYANTELDRRRLQNICESENINLLISSYYTTALTIPYVFMAYDMIPEQLKFNFNEVEWREKAHAVCHAESFICISENTAKDLVRFYPDTAGKPIQVAHCGGSSAFYPSTSQEVQHFRTRFKISKPYFILSGARWKYKNLILFFKAFVLLKTKNDLEIVCTGGKPVLEPELQPYAKDINVKILHLDDNDLRSAYSGSTALVYPSIYEGFGLPVVEAMACGCPVITSPTSSLPEVAGGAAIYVQPHDLKGMIEALTLVQNPKLRLRLKPLLIQQAGKFSWHKMAEIMSTFLLKISRNKLSDEIFGGCKSRSCFN